LDENEKPLSNVSVVILGQQKGIIHPILVRSG
jgi:hypothetical protein